MAISKMVNISIQKLSLTIHRNPQPLKNQIIKYEIFIVNTFSIKKMVRVNLNMTAANDIYILIKPYTPNI